MSKSALFVALLLGMAAGCDKPTAVQTEASANTASLPAPKPKPTVIQFTKMPDLVIDEMGAYFGGQRADPSKPAGQAKLRKIISGLPIDDTPVTIRVLKQAKASHVREALFLLGQGGATRIVMKTEGRGDLPAQIELVPENLIQNPAPCSVVASVTDDLSTAVWAFKGGGGRKHRKGLAGPDLTTTGDSIRKALARCNSDTAFFAGSDKHAWPLSYNLGALIRQQDDAKAPKIKRLVFVGDAPVAGRAVKLHD